MRVSVSALLVVLVIASTVCLSSSLKLDARRKAPAHHRPHVHKASVPTHKVVTPQAKAKAGKHGQKQHHHKVASKAGKKLHNLEKDVTVEELKASVTAGLNDVQLIKNALADADADLHKDLEEISEINAEKAKEGEKQTAVQELAAKDVVAAEEDEDDEDEENVASENAADSKEEPKDETKADFDEDGNAKEDEKKEEESATTTANEQNDNDAATTTTATTSAEDKSEDETASSQDTSSDAKKDEDVDAEAEKDSEEPDASEAANNSEEGATTDSSESTTTTTSTTDEASTTASEKTDSAEAGNDVAKDAEEDMELDEDEEEAVMDLESVALLQQASNDVSFDDMNDYATADDNEIVGVGHTKHAPRAVHLAGQANAPKVEEGGDPRDRKYVFGTNSDGGTSDVVPTAAGQDFHPQQAVVDETADKSMNPSEKVVTLEDGMADVGELPAGTGGGNKNPVPGGKTPQGPSKDNASEDDSVCMCKRQGAPRKMKAVDRVKCKRHPSPTPTPEPIAEGIRQCVTGTWPGKKGDSMDANTTDTICIYFPARLPTPPEVAPEREFPDECYDDRNEFVVEGLEKRPFDEFLIQTGAYAACDC